MALLILQAMDIFLMPMVIRYTIMLQVILIPAESASTNISYLPPFNHESHPKSGGSFYMFKISFLNIVIKRRKNIMTSYCYRYDVYNRYRVGGDPTKRFAKRPRMSKIYRLSLKVTVPLANFVLPKIYKMESVMESFQGKIHMMAFQRKRIKRFVHRSVMVILRLDAPIRVAIMVAFTALYGCALIALLNI